MALLDRIGGLARRASKIQPGRSQRIAEHVASRRGLEARRRTDQRARCAEQNALNEMRDELERFAPLDRRRTRRGRGTIPATSEGDAELIVSFPAQPAKMS
jgi:hypothetical protein